MSGLMASCRHDTCHPLFCLWNLVSRGARPAQGVGRLGSLRSLQRGLQRPRGAVRDRHATWLFSGRGCTTSGSSSACRQSDLCARQGTGPTTPRQPTCPCSCPCSCPGVCFTACTCPITDRITGPITAPITCARSPRSCGGTACRPGRHACAYPCGTFVAAAGVGGPARA